MTTEQNIRRYLYIGDEVRFLNSNKKYVYVNIRLDDLFKKIKIKLSNKWNIDGFDLVYTREEFNKILKTEWYKDSLK